MYLCLLQNTYQHSCLHPWYSPQLPELQPLKGKLMCCVNEADNVNNEAKLLTPKIINDILTSNTSFPFFWLGKCSILLTNDMLLLRSIRITI